MSRQGGTVRPAAVAGRFYPAQPESLERLVRTLLAGAQTSAGGNAKALVAPHAGYVFSGPIAGSAFRTWTGSARSIRRVVLLGPSHYVDFPGLALPVAAGFCTPFGAVAVDAEAVERLRALPCVRENAEAHEREHSLEVELPFLQQVLPAFSMVPLVIGDATDDQVARVVEALWDGDETRFVLSTDLSHYHPYATARQIDRATAAAIERFQPGRISAEQACGHLAIRGFLKAAESRGLDARTLDLRNSGDTAGSRDSVVGYGAFAFAEKAPHP